MYLCLCRNLTESGFRGIVQSFVQSGAAPSDVLAEDTLIDTLGLEHEECCGQCVREIDRFVELACSVLSDFSRASATPRILPQ